MLDCEIIASKKKEEIKNIIINNNLKLHMLCILVGDNPASLSYIKGKEKDCNEVGIKFTLLKLDEKIKEEELLNIIDKYNNDDNITGMIVQMPLPKHIDENKVIEKISIKKDIDGFNPINIGKIFLNQKTIIPCTPKGIMMVFDYYNINLESKKAVIIGRSNIVGKPISGLLLNKNATVSICHSKTKNLNEYTLDADIIIAAVGIKYFLKKDMIKKDAILIDVGINRENKKLYGDVDIDCYNITNNYTKVPKGIGLLTRVALLENIVELYMR